MPLTCGMMVTLERSVCRGTAWMFTPSMRMPPSSSNSMVWKKDSIRLLLSAALRLTRPILDSIKSTLRTKT